ncbi:gluconate 2-dehydrogenase subunit 3 family protein [Vulgatibacter incomptus]|uniref:Putative oxidoreductase n=1 Tax=Vulgatibacter incomptus TaxID=1391653 RepID=A0A0K1PI95_9BACT|nr:gluconate 2-dehydrogenase subunit 3 family protein [Vulgatibacter incomptus]AKU93258.1 putative oxidoreductase [Vulgatibacter incomptus]
MPITRRAVLKYGLGGALALSAGGVGLSFQRTASRTPSRPLRALDPRSFAILAAVAERISPAGDGFPAASELEVAEAIDGLLATSHPAVLDEVKQLLALVENGLAGMLLDGRPQPFTSLSPDDQDRALLAWRRSSLGLRRTAYKALHGLCAAAYYASPRIYPQVGYPGPPSFAIAVPTAIPEASE